MANQRKGGSPDKQAWSLTYTKNGGVRLRGPQWSKRACFGIASAVFLLVGVAGTCQIPGDASIHPSYKSQTCSKPCRLMHQEQCSAKEQDIHRVQVSTASTGDLGSTAM